MMSRLLSALMLPLCLVVVAGCQSGERPRPRALPLTAAAQAQVPNQGTIRFWGDEASPSLQAYVDDQFRQIRAGDDEIAVGRSIRDQSK